jgi:hypothetical protein
LEPLTKEQAIIITGYTGIGACDFSDFHEDVEKRMNRPVWTHEFGSSEMWEQLKILYREDFLKLCYGRLGTVPPAD